MIYILKIIVLVNLVSCSFESKKESEEVEVVEDLPLSTVQVENIDSDGDRINDNVELEKGYDRYVANLPRVEISFLQDYSIRMEYEDNSVFEIDTVIRRSNPEFKYRVGSLFLSQNSLDHAARIGRFSGHSWGSIDQKDFSWVMYPEIDQEYFHSKVLEYKEYANKALHVSSVSLENSLKLQQTGLYNSIEELELNFYYYSHSREAYVLLGTRKIEKTFQAGVREKFFVEITNPPLELLEDSYLRHGEFIISEIKDYYIPELGIKYSNLLKSVKEKSIPVNVTTPFESSIHYVSVGKDGKSFTDVMEMLFPGKFTVRDNSLIRVEQFENNLREFNSLHELNAIDKEGRWYVMTNKLKQHYLKHTFTPADSITLSYITGEELSQRTEESIFASSEEVYSGESFKKYILGNITKNSKLNFSVYLNALRGKELVSKPGSFIYRPDSCRNCSGNDWNVSASFTVNEFKDFERSFDVTTLGEIKDSVQLEINGKVQDMDKLIEADIGSLELKNDVNGQYLHFRINRLDQLSVVRAGMENVASLRISPLVASFAAKGLRIDSISGRNIDRTHHAGLIALQQASKRNIPIAVTSWNFSKWQQKVSWGRKFPDGYTPVKGQKEKYWSGIVVNIVCSITNYFN